MTNHELYQGLLLSISDMLDEKLDVKLNEKLDAKLDVKLGEKLDARLSRIEARLDESDAKLKLMQEDMRDIKLNIENDIKPQIQLLAENYVPAAKRYEKAAAQVEILQSDMDIVKKVVTEHSVKLQRIS